MTLDHPTRRRLLVTIGAHRRDRFTCRFVRKGDQHNRVGCDVIPNKVILFLMIILCTIGLAVFSYMTNGIVLLMVFLNPSTSRWLPAEHARRHVYLSIHPVHHKEEVFTTYFKKGDLSAKVIPEPYVGCSK